MPRTKIVCTIGPASRSPETLERLIRAGMDVARLNFSHGTQAEHLEVITTVRRIATDLGRSVAILQDLAGLKIRIGEIASGSVTLEAGAPFTLTTREVLGSRQEVSVPYPHLTKDVQPGDTLLLSDGDVELEVIGTTEEDVRCQVITGGTLASRKGVHFPARSITAAAFTDKDRDDLAFGLRYEVDYVALSFVRTAADVLDVQGMIQDHGSTVPVIAKIETQSALTNIDEIIDRVDGIMVARGDLGVAIPLATVPRLQKMLIGKANRAGKPVITATQMLRSMQDSPRPTRAEVTDVANAVLDGTDAVMLSEETAIGRFPFEAVTMMAAIAADTESSFPFDAWIHRFEASGPLPDAVARAACTMAAEIDAAAILTLHPVGRYRPAGRPVSAPRSDHRPNAARRDLSPAGARLGRHAAADSEPADDGSADRRALGAALAAACVRRGDTVVITAGVPVGCPGTTNSIKVETL